MGQIRELPPSVVNQIAAGEVVERPASVVKELLENAIDAGSTRVELSVERGGRDLVRVADDGSGIAREDLPLAFRPHATSKLVGAEDLHSIRTLGFRGEALAAIAEISRVRCQTRTADSEVGSEIRIEGGEASEIKDCGCPVGTSFEIRNLFFNTPVRRTFLKSDTTEAGHVAEMFTRIALAHPTIHLTYRSAGKTLYDLPPVTGLKERVAVFFGRELAEALLWVESEVDDVHLWGYVAHPSQSRSSAKGQYLFVGGRYVKDRSLAHALAEAYRGLLMVGRIPVAFLHLELPPEEVDVNVHPTKVEVRFRDSQRIYGQLLRTVRQTFLTSDLHGRLQAPPARPEVTPPGPSDAARPGSPGASGSSDFALRPGVPDRQTVASWFPPSGSSSTPPDLGPLPVREEPDWARALPPRPEPGAAPPPAFDEFGGETSDPSGPPSPPSASASASAGPVAGASAAARPVEELASLPPRAIQVHDSYLIAETEDGMVVIDQHALHERILFEEFRGRVERGGVESQRLLVPEPVELGADEAAEVLERREVLARLGLEVEPFGGGTVLVGSVPAMLGPVSPTRLLRDLAEQLVGRAVPPSADAVLNDVLSLMACKAAVKAGQRLSADEVTALLSRRHLVTDHHHCPHGRPTALVFTKEELEKQFGRV
ncbi:DNA mismatch repair endonuclease MutL [Tautonia plasticadhaerens]|uniref:DNA mismatch repair protein MutL n=1 Tax=Tautonia plasticadhaerens TaxID=2527974 RepID=A0A518GZ96_9BACT|nr:DNA mismatch repair endonuclease MutL [Tautonia plasticadhaerens]QDV33872.1 DNA mismatch repair protein MutL [Tautonia plasticadhaerens]